MTFKRPIRIAIPIVVWIWLFSSYSISVSAQHSEVISERLNSLSTRVRIAEDQNYPQRLAVLENRLDTQQKSLDKIEGWAEKLVWAILYLIGESIVKLYNAFTSRTRRTS